jgi:hypothetical protein
MTKEEKLRARYNAELAKLEDQRLPGANDHLAQNGDVAKWMTGQQAKIERAIGDEDDILYERSVGGWLKGWEKINTTLAEAYRESTDPEEWELRYVRWMKIIYMKFECEMGIFYIVPRKPETKPKAKHWFTVDEMLEILGSPTTVAVIQTFKSLPVRPKSIDDRVPAGEKHLIMDFTGKADNVYYKWEGSVDRG